RLESLGASIGIWVCGAEALQGSARDSSLESQRRIPPAVAGPRSSTFSKTSLVGDHESKSPSKMGLSPRSFCSTTFDSKEKRPPKEAVVLSGRGCRRRGCRRRGCRRRGRRGSRASHTMGRATSTRMPGRAAGAWDGSPLLHHLELSQQLIIVLHHLIAAFGWKRRRLGLDEFTRLALGSEGLADVRFELRTLGTLGFDAFDRGRHAQRRLGARGAAQKTGGHLRLVAGKGSFSQSV